MISCPTVRKSSIRSHYELSTLFYWLLWGRHIHHGL
jgi:tocopherol O-methyltransferase